MRESGEVHAWEIGRGWDLYYTGVITALLVFNALTTEPGPRLWIATALGATLLPLYWFAAHRLNRNDEHGTPPTRVFVLVVAAICSTIIVLSDNMGFAVLALSPLCFMTGGAVYGALALAIMLVAPSVVQGVAEGAPPAQLMPGVAANLMIAGFGFWLARWYEKVVEQSWERAELIEQLRESRAEATRLSEQAGAMAEREHLAREMHDTLAQGFTSIITLTQAVESEMGSDPAAARRHLALMRETATDNLAETRAMVAARGPVPLEEDDLEAALARLAERSGSELGITICTEVVGSGLPLPGDAQVCLLRTAQEALANVRKHSGAGSARVRLAHTDVGVSLTVRDDGRGFDPGNGNGHGNGLANMRRRALDLNGVLDVESDPGQGTTVRLSLATEDPEDAEPASDSGTAGAAGRHNDEGTQTETAAGAPRHGTEETMDGTRPLTPRPGETP
ncbi:sensor histidine kinase [Nocardiopsis sp. HNM0947]|uniref:Oxygen sensor histidine kinase NreB n=1 Tax=Nocardiopsis coralli TaxID=2772213 RepID=A0ABR9PCC8_9ACTN|nr:sensor histidine kinase [Nocardiopsis coralli]MBE3001488.1 sensor histidine kinase [Nocardiopsis coralli]